MLHERYPHIGRPFTLDNNLRARTLDPYPTLDLSDTTVDM